MPTDIWSICILLFSTICFLFAFHRWIWKVVRQFTRCSIDKFGWYCKWICRPIKWGAGARSGRMEPGKCVVCERSVDKFETQMFCFFFPHRNWHVLKRKLQHYERYLHRKCVTQVNWSESWASPFGEKSPMTWIKVWRMYARVMCSRKRNRRWRVRPKRRHPSWAGWPVALQTNWAKWKSPIRIVRLKSVLAVHTKMWRYVLTLLCGGECVFSFGNFKFSVIGFSFFLDQGVNITFWIGAQFYRWQ